MLNTNHPMIELGFWAGMGTLALLGIHIKFNAVIMNGFFDVMEILLTFIVKASVPIGIYLKYEERIDRKVSRIWRCIKIKRRRR